MFKIRTLKNFASEINLFTYNSGAKNKQNPTNFSDFTKLINSISSTNTVHCKKKEVAELEKKDIIYMPFPANEDMFLQILSINVPRVLSGPPPPCIKHIIKIFDKKRTKKFIESRKNELDFGEKFYQQQKNNFTKEGIQYVHSLNSELTKLAGEYLALGQIIFISKDETSNLKLSKVYVLGHGNAGDKNIYDTARSDSQTKSAADLVGELKELIKIDQSIDIRLTSSESADAYTIRSFKNTESDKNKKIYVRLNL